VRRSGSHTVIASGGGGSTLIFVDVFQRGKAAALAACIFHFGLRRFSDLKQELQTGGVWVRWPC